MQHYRCHLSLRDLLLEGQDVVGIHQIDYTTENFDVCMGLQSLRGGGAVLWKELIPEQWKELIREE
jgi:hypothetical protein